MTRCITGKVIHQSKGAALHARANQAAEFKCLAAYHCKVCGNWHLGQDRSGGKNFQNFIDRVLERDRKMVRP